VALGSANTRALILFDGGVDGYYTAQFGQLAVTPSTTSIPYSVIKPDNTVLVSGNISMSVGTYRPTIHLPKLPSTGTYSILVSPGIATFNSNVKVVTDPVLPLDGAAVAVTLDTVGQTARVALDATVGQKIGLGITGFNLSPTSASNTAFKLYKPDQMFVADIASCFVPSASNTQGNCDGEIEATVAGRHTIVAQTVATSAAAFGIQASSEVTGTLAADAGADMNLTRVGQDARHTFTVTAGDNLGLALSALTAQPQATRFSAKVLKPDGTTVVSLSATEPAGAYVEMGTLATAGTYTIALDPDFGAYGTARLTLKQGGLLQTSDSPASFAPATNGEAARFRFSGTAGQNLAVGIASLTNVVGGSGNAATLSVYAPDRSLVGSSVTCSPSLASGRCKATLTNLPQTGAYSVVVLPYAGQATKISGSASISADITGTLTAGTPASVSATRDGQNARYTFSATAGDTLLVKVYGVSTTPTSQPLTAKILRPDGVIYTSSSVSSSASGALLLANAPATGTYTVLLEPFYGVTWQATLALDAGTTATVDGSTIALASAAGEPLLYRFAGTSGQRIEWGIGALAYGVSSSNGTAFGVYSPTGSSLTSTTCYTTGAGNCELGYTSLPSTGTYSVVLTPPAASAISGATFAISTPLSGTFVVGNPAQTVAITRPGQTVRYTFSGTASQLLRLNWSSATVGSSATVAVSVLKPDGSTLSSSSFVNGASSGLDIASLPSTGTYTIVLDPSLAATMSASMSLVTR
jgi:hypothetical protein